MQTMTILIHPNYNEELYLKVLRVLDKAVEDFPDLFYSPGDNFENDDHYGYEDDELASVILSREYQSIFYRLCIPSVSHPVFSELASIVAAQLLSGRI